MFKKVNSFYLPTANYGKFLRAFETIYLVINLQLNDSKTFDIIMIYFLIKKGKILLNFGVSLLRLGLRVRNEKF